MWLLIIIFIQAIIIMIRLLWLYYCMCIQHACNHNGCRILQTLHRHTYIQIYIIITQTYTYTCTDMHTQKHRYKLRHTSHTYIHSPSLSRITICIVDGDTTLQNVIPGSISSTVKLWVPSKASSSIFLIVTHFCVPIWEPAR